MSPVGAEDRRAVERVTRSLYTAIETADLDLMQAVWLDSDDIVCVHPGWPALRGRGQVMRSWAVVMGGAPYVQFFLTDLETRIEGDTAVVTCGESMLTGAEGSEDGFVGARAVSTKVLTRTPGGWRVVVHHSSPVLGTSEDDDDDHMDDDDADDGTGTGPQGTSEGDGPRG
ncbi:ketosteroid isomerase-like protein [Motilibacter rhizosphaerae]|uniref:Ketosteroid isomerase-like protein n=1 Tax=Motilibacter rhizosphaerae TaxID=598652 RepID=A0A4Q7NAP9_9ACTN|nr:nuclear transport factor 2 family protein [Motilibacter rhizosphaerae]RZS79432.1 ketosteroid isomerase-like protein [Motilibacter rhizosphaerae]